MAANANFSLKLTLAETNSVKRAMEERYQRLLALPFRDLTDEEKGDIQAYEKMLRLDF